ncbi:MAG TPA: hypothetical protein VIM76_04845 [Candidatus Dormibacteraeota bacterium]
MLLIVVGGLAFVTDRALAAPVLGPPPAGPSHGANEVAIAVAVGEQMVAQLLTGSHGVIVLSEQDLTVLAIANNPHPNAYRHVAVRVRDGLVVASAQISTGPFSPTAVAHISLSLRPGSSGPVVAAQLPEVDVGLLPLPGFVATGLVEQIDAALSLDRLFSVAPQLKALRADIECVAVVPGGVAVGIHDPGVAAVASSCG